MKKTLLILCAMAIALSFASCEKKETETGTEEAEQQIEETAEGTDEAEEDETSEENEDEQEVSGDAETESAVTEYSSLQELVEKESVNFVAPGVMGKTEETFRAIDKGEYKIAEYCFNIAGISYTWRNAATFEDILDGECAFDEEIPEGIEIIENDTEKFARWFTVDGQYTLKAEGEIESETFAGVADELCELVSNSVSDDVKAGFYNIIDGNYQDKTSGRASMVVTAKEDGVDIKINWADSAFETVEWTMFATVDDDKLLNYENGTKKLIKTDEDGKETVEELASDEAGNFSFDENDNILWTGAPEESCRECVFERLPVVK